MRFRLALEVRHPLLQLDGSAVAPADEARAHALAREVRQLALDRLAEDLHQRVDLVRRRVQFSVENA